MRVWFAGGGTGGHLYPGLAIARALVRLDPAIEPFFIGARRGIERDVLPTQGFPFELLDLHPLYRQRPWENWKTVRGAFGAWQKLTSLAAEKAPDVLFGTGGYAMGIGAAWAGAHGVPVAQIVADVHPGLTAKLAARWSSALYLGFPEAVAQLPGKGAKSFTGNPIEPPPSPRPSRVAARVRWGFPHTSGHVLLVFGGSQGARAINETVAAWVRQGLPDGLCLIWATGKGQYQPYQSLESARVRVVPYLSPIAEAYAASDFALTRAGAITCAEVAAWGLPAIMVPLPTAAADHQTTNAMTLERAGAAVCIRQETLTLHTLAAAVEKIRGESGRLAQMQEASLKRARPNAAMDIAVDVASRFGRAKRK
jgi:UDP-N-acetylglucosamine--N-acetylmuramyl-(pentapeptide) pyrophosphoryl-undecaprenol N-acetylglucosamine transferase